MKKIAVLPLFVLFSIIAYSQDHFFAFVDIPTGKAGAETAVNYKLQTTQIVFDSLVEGLGNFRLARPTLLMKNSERYVAWAQPERAEIGLEELAYDICVSFGPDSLNALAALLAHELVHYYKEHRWSRHFIEQNRELSTAQELEKLNEGINFETQADYFGGFLAYSVGFDVLGVMPELLKKVYAEDAYDLPEEIDGYPSLKDRVAISEKEMQRLKELQIVFETATYLNLLEKHDVADQYYRFILRDFQSRDIYNNAGVSALLSALPFFTKKEIPYGLPIELDPKSRLEQRVTRDMDLTRKQEREKRIQRALAYFDQALSLDGQYAPAFLNKAATFVLLQDWEEANYWLRKARKEKHSDKISADLLVLEGVIAAQQQDTEGAGELWERAQKMNSYLAKLNLQVLQSGSLPPKPDTDTDTDMLSYANADKKEQIDQLDLKNFIKQTAPDETIKIDPKTNTICGLHRRPESHIYSHSVDYGKEFISIQVVDKTFTGKSLEGIQIGDAREKLFEMYSEPERQVQTPEGSFLIYPNRNMFFRLNEEETVAGWGVYRIK